MPAVNGEFDVKLLPAPNASLTEGCGIGRMTLDKRYHGPLEAEGYGEFLSYRSAVPTSAVYVAIEKVKGTLDGRHGSFALQHPSIRLITALYKNENKRYMARRSDPGRAGGGAVPWRHRPDRQWR
ncbi:DUF3224 domain-containing protein [Pseudoduganella sp. RAF53_2]|uniref:DUF3224 domain-containing protein n=1 Tax=Pseudoduganella sp. RAF53_2 TaxID=3233060 RepID=UPI003F966A8F